MKIKVTVEQLSMLRVACLLAAKRHTELANSVSDCELQEILESKAATYNELYRMLHS
mgnify:CR=1 FL=1